jgi:predicted SnoaL-like aldol condensation-catalyzing enzyme
LRPVYINPRKYIEHNPRSADGIDGLREYIDQVSKENHHFKVARAFQDGPYVFTQGEGLMLGQNIFFRHLQI